MRVFSLFSGIGGFEVGLEKAGDIEVVGAADWNRFASSVYSRHYPDVHNYGNATTIDTNELPNFELLVAGFPCPAFSIAGDRKGFDDFRGQLFFQVARFLSDRKPQYFLLENVKGMVSAGGGEVFPKILETLSSLGYMCQWQVLNSNNFASLQQRERVFIFGHLGGIGGPQVFPIIPNEWYVHPDKPFAVARKTKSARRGITGMIDPGYSKGLGSFGQRTFVLKQRDNVTALDASYSKGIDNHEQRTGVLDKDNLRLLTPKECERLQGFPDDWTKYGKDDEEISDTQRYKMLGNAVPTNVVEAIGKRFL